MKMLRRTAILFVALLLALSSSLRAAPDDGGSINHRIKHVFVIVLENEGFDVTFGPNSKAPFLSKTLTSRGVLLNQYFGTGHVSLDNYIAMISGQAATPDTRNDCQIFADFVLTGTYSLLKSLGDIFDTDAYLGFAGAPGLVGFFGCVTSDIAVKDQSQTAHCDVR